jgi:hypothetical protein
MKIGKTSIGGMSSANPAATIRPQSVIEDMNP